MQRDAKGVRGGREQLLLYMISLEGIVYNHEIRIHETNKVKKFEGEILNFIILIVKNTGKTPDWRRLVSPQLTDEHIKISVFLIPDQINSLEFYLGHKNFPKIHILLPLSDGGAYF